jgi:hypothetical protein
VRTAKLYAAALPRTRSRAKSKDADNLTIEEEDIERLVKALDTQYAYTRAKQFEDSNYKRLADLFRQFLKKPSR